MDAGFTPVNGFLGGALIGLAAVLLLVANGRIAGVSGIVGGLLARAPGDVSWRAAFVLGFALPTRADIEPRLGSRRGALRYRLGHRWPVSWACGDCARLR
jgi:hypothetical protein